jgi:hypothetical protein
LERSCHALILMGDWRVSAQVRNHSQGEPGRAEVDSAPVGYETQGLEGFEEPY